MSNFEHTPRENHGIVKGKIPNESSDSGKAVSLGREETRSVSGGRRLLAGPPLYF